jgi:hypothetical protein
MDEFPKLGKYPNEATREELIEYADKLTDWCVMAELKLKLHKEIL